MSKLISAKLVPYFINGGGFDIEVVSDKAPCNLTFDVRGGIYRGDNEESDFVQFYAYDAPGKGFGGARVNITMKTGGNMELIGPWSSRAGVVNQMYPEREPVVEVIDLSDGYRMVAHVKKSALERLGIKLEEEIKWEGEQYFNPVQPFPVADYVNLYYNFQRCVKAAKRTFCVDKGVQQGVYDAVNQMIHYTLERFERGHKIISHAFLDLKNDTFAI